MPGPTLDKIVETFGAASLDVWAPPPNWRAPLRDVVIHDAAEDFAAGVGDLLLAVGTDAAQVRALLRSAAQAEVGAVVVRGNPRLREELSAASCAAGVALLALAPDIGWVDFADRLRHELSPEVEGLDADFGDPQDLVSFANALCELVGGSVMIFNPGQEVLAASRLADTDDAMRRQAVLEQRGPAWYRNRLRAEGVYRRLWQTEEVVDVPAIPEHGVGRRLVMAIRAGEEILGSIWVAERDTPLAGEAAQVLARAARAAAHHLRRPYASGPNRYLEGVVRRMMTGSAEEGTLAASGWLDADPQGLAAVLTCMFTDGRRGGERRLGELMSLGLGEPGGVVVPVISRGRVDLLVCDLPAGTGTARLGRVASAIAERASRSLERAVLCAVGPVVAGLDAVATSHREAGLALRALQSDGAAGTRVATHEEVRERTALLALTDLVAGDRRFATGPVLDLIAHDRAHRTSYAASLRAYLDAFGDMIAAARTLNVHPNTLRYRIRRIPELCGLDVSDPDARLLAALQLRMAEAGRGLEHATSPEPKVRTSA
jgi:hypothetical protein